LHCIVNKDFNQSLVCEGFLIIYTELKSLPNRKY